MMLVMLYYIERATSFVLHRVPRKTCLIAVARHWCELLTVRPHHWTDPEALYHGRSTVEDICSLPRWYYWNCAYSTRNGISGSFSIGNMLQYIQGRPDVVDADVLP